MVLLGGYSGIMYIKSMVMTIMTAMRGQKYSHWRFYLIVYNDLFQIFRTPNSYIDINIIEEAHISMLVISKDKIDVC